MARFNAVKDGFFAEHIVIPRIDEPYSEELPALLNGLRSEFHPEGLLEEFYVMQMLHAMWKLRRARRCEKSSVRREALWEENSPPDESVVLEREAFEVAVLRAAQREF
jgi:hypothetical protein